MAEFRADQTTPGAGVAGKARTDLVAGEVITLVATAPVGAGVTYAWELVDVVGSEAALTAGTGITVDIGPDSDIVELCGFKVRLTANDGGDITVSERIFCVRSSVTGLRPLMFGETSPSSQTLGANDPDLSTDNSTYADLAGTGVSGDNWRGYGQAFYEMALVIEGLSGGGYIPSGPASGDLGSTYPNPTVVGLRGRAVAATAPSDGQALTWSASNNRWEPGAGGGGGGSPFSLLSATAPGTTAAVNDDVPAGSWSLTDITSPAGEPATGDDPYYLILNDGVNTETVQVIARAGSTRTLAKATGYGFLSSTPTTVAFAGYMADPQDDGLMPAIDWIRLRQVAPYAQRTGITEVAAALSTATADLNFAGVHLANVADPTDPQHAATQASVEDDLATQASCGVISGGIVTKTSPTKLSVAAGVGTFPSGANLFVQWVTTGGITASAPLSWAIVDDAGNVSLTTNPPTPSSRRLSLYLARISVNGGVIDDVAPIAMPSADVGQSLADLWDQGIGITRLDGATMEAASTDLTLELVAGTVMARGGGADLALATNPHTVIITGSTPLTFRMLTSTGQIASDETDLPVDTYDVSGTPTTIPGASSSVSIFTCYLFPGGATGGQAVRVAYDQDYYASFEEAQLAIETRQFTVPPEATRDAAFVVGWILARKDATDLSDAAQARFIHSDRFGSPLGVAVLPEETAVLEPVAADTPGSTTNPPGNAPAGFYAVPFGGTITGEPTDASIPYYIHLVNTSTMDEEDALVVYRSGSDRVLLEPLQYSYFAGNFTIAFAGYAYPAAAGSVQADEWARIRAGTYHVENISDAFMRSTYGTNGVGAGTPGIAYTPRGFVGDVLVTGSLTATGESTGAALAPITEAGTTRTLQLSDNGRVIICTNAAGCTLTVPNTGVNNVECLIYGTQGLITFVDGGGNATVTKAASVGLTTAEVYSPAYLKVAADSSTYELTGDLLPNTPDPVTDGDFSSNGRMVRTGAGTYVTVFDNFVGVSAPTVADDNTLGYSAGSIFLNTVTGNSYLCVSAGTGAAVWRSMGALATIARDGLIASADYDRVLGDAKNQEVLFRDEFEESTTGKWTGTVSGSGATVAVVVGGTTYASMLRLNMGTTTTGSASLDRAINSFYTNRYSRFDWEVKCRLSALSNGTDEYDAFVCYSGVNGISFTYDRNTSLNWQATQWAAGVPTHTDTGIVADTAMHSFRWVWTSAAGGTVTLYIDGVAVGAPYTGVTFAATTLTPGRAVKSAGTTSPFLYLDFTQGVGTLATPRP